MAATYTTNTKLIKPGSNDPGWGPQLNANVDALDALATIGGGAVTPTEVPSATLNVRVAACAFVAIDGTIQTTSGTASLALAASTVNQIYLDNTGGIHAVTTGFPAPGAGYVPLAAVLTGGGSLISISDQRQFMRVVGFRRAGAAQTALTDSTGGSTATFVLNDVTATPTQALINSNFAKVAVLLNELRAALVERQQIKGSA